MKTECKNINSITTVFLYLSLNKHKYRAITIFGNKKENGMAGKTVLKEHFENTFMY